MALRDLLVHLDHTQAGALRLRLAAALAVRHQARLVVLHVRERTGSQVRQMKSAELGLMPSAEMERFDREIVKTLDDEASRLEELTRQVRAEFNLDTEWRWVAGSPGTVVPQQGRYADLVVVGHDGSSPDALSANYTLAETTLFLTGRPVILVPVSVTAPVLGHRIVLAWNGSRPAARALADALPLIEKCASITVLIVNQATLGRPGAIEVDAIAANLARHCPVVDVSSLEVPEGSIGDALQVRALEVGADLLIAGAYGHPRLWEKLLGGVTRDMLARTMLPVLMSH